METLEAAARDYMSEYWVDVLVDVWPDIVKQERVMTKLPKILRALTRNIVTNEYLEKLRNLQQNTGSSREISALLETSIERAVKNINRFRIMRMQFAKAFNSK